MTFRLVTALLQEETFSWTPEGEGTEFHIRSGELRRMLHEKAMDKLTTLHFPPEETLEELIRQHGLEQPRIESMTEEEAKDPVIVGIMPSGSHILIDGGHRRYFWAKRGIHTLRGWAVPQAIWSLFQFELGDFGITAIHHRDGSLLPQRRRK